MRREQYLLLESAQVLLSHELLAEAASCADARLLRRTVHDVEVAHGDEVIRRYRSESQHASADSDQWDEATKEEATAVDGQALPGKLPVPRIAITGDTQKECKHGPGQHETKSSTRSLDKTLELARVVLNESKLDHCA